MPRRPNQYWIGSRLLPAAAAILGTAALALVHASIVRAAAADNHPRGSAPAEKAKPGDIVHILDKAHVRVVTDAADPIALAETLLAGSHPADRRVFTVAEWSRLSRGDREKGTYIFLIDRQSLDQGGEMLPVTCYPLKDQVKIAIAISDSPTSRARPVNHLVTISAPDATWLRAAVDDFRQIAGPPRDRAVSFVRDVRPLNVIALGGVGAAKVGAAPLLAHVTPASDSQPAVRPNSMSRDRWQVLTNAQRLADTDEAILIDRAHLDDTDASLAATICAEKMIAPGDTVAWRERKADGTGWRTIISAPSAELIAAAVRTRPDLGTLGETPTVVLAARDLRTVRRIVVAGLKTGVGGEELANILASRAATDLRALDSFEVLERAGMNEILSEIALGQAGITQAKDRTRVRQLAAADALLIVEVTDIGGRTDYTAASTRLTAPLDKPPKKPIEPSHLKYAISLPGKENDATAQAITDAVLGRVVGKKSDQEYDRSMRIYARETLPAWQRQMDEYNYQHDHRAVDWQQKITPHSACTVSGSLRMVDLTDGLVMWETPFSVTCKEDGTLSTRKVTTRGEESTPPEAIDADTEIPDGLKSRTAESAVASAIGTLTATAMLPPTTTGSPAVLCDPIRPAGAMPGAPAPVAGRIIDIDGGQILVGIGSADGVRTGDRLRVDLGGGKSVGLVVTHIRPHTCDCAFVKPGSAILAGKVAVGMSASVEIDKREVAR